MRAGPSRNPRSRPGPQPRRLCFCDLGKRALAGIQAHPLRVRRGACRASIHHKAADTARCERPNKRRRRTLPDAGSLSPHALRFAGRGAHRRPALANDGWWHPPCTEVAMERCPLGAPGAAVFAPRFARALFFCAGRPVPSARIARTRRTRRCLQRRNNCARTWRAVAKAPKPMPRAQTSGHPPWFHASTDRPDPSAPPVNMVPMKTVLIRALACGRSA